MIEEINKYVGKQGYIIHSGLEILVEIKDVKQSYGKIRYNVTPISGNGQVWVEKITLKK